MRAVSSTFTFSINTDSRYTVYLAEIRKRLVYFALSLFFAWVCAYTQRVALMYSVTFSLQQAFPEKSKIQQIDNTFESYNCNHAAAERITSQKVLYEAFDAKTLSLYDSSPSCTINEISTLCFDNQSETVHGGVRLIFTDVGEAFYTLLSISLFWCFWACFPVLVYHILCFFQPGFYIGQSKRVCAFVCQRLAFGYLVLWLVDLFLIPRLLSFFYSFSIERSSLSLHAETKVVSYVSLYLFVYGITVTLLLLTTLWGFYRRRQILDWLDKFKYSTDSAPGCLSRNQKSNRYQDIVLVTRSKNSDTDKQFLSSKYRSQRGKVWWGCLLVAAFVSPPDISSQLVCALLLILWSEVGIWLAYTSSCRFWGQIHNSFLSS